MFDIDAPVKVYESGREGRYSCICVCGNRFIGHKRDNTCPTCESKKPVQLELDLTNKNNNNKGQYYGIPEISELDK